jgi:Cu/Ag efflux protein CusF
MSRWQAILVAAGFALGISLSGSASAQTSAPTTTEAPESIRSATVLTIHGKIAAVDEARKLVTLEANGKRVTFTVDNPYNLKAAKVGDPVVVRYYEVVSVRKKKPGEEVPAVSLTEGIATAQSGTPGAVAEQRASVLVTVTEVDPENGTVTIKGPDGSVEKVKATNPKVLKHIKAGDQLVVTISRATAIAIEKETAG